MYKVNKYPDGSSYVEVTSGVSETVRVNSYEDLWHLRQLIDAKNSVGIEPSITIPNLIDAQADRRFLSVQSSGLSLVLWFLKGLKATFKIFHPHNPEVVEAVLGDKAIIMNNSSFIHEVLRSLTLHSPEVVNNLILMSTDAGGFKPLMKLCDHLNWQGEVFSASKSREFKDGHTKLTQKVDRQDFGGKDILIIDDICVAGGTFIGLSKMLKERNVGKIYLAVSHMTIQDLNKELFDSFDRVFTTNSKYNEYFYKAKEGGIKPSNLTVYPIFKTTKNV